MATVLLATGDDALREACRAQLEAGGHAPVLLDRPLASLTLARKVSWDAALVDASELGRETLRTLSTLDRDGAALVGLGLDDAALRASIPLPLVAERLLSTLSDVIGTPSEQEGAGPLTLDAARRLALSDGREVALTRTEFRLLQVLLERQPREVPLLELLQSVWGFTEGRGTSELVRAHVRNLRLKLGQLGLPDAVRSRRGQGYALVV